MRTLLSSGMRGDECKLLVIECYHRDRYDRKGAEIPDYEVLLSVVLKVV